MMFLDEKSTLEDVLIVLFPTPNFKMANWSLRGVYQ